MIHSQRLMDCKCDTGKCELHVKCPREKCKALDDPRTLEEISRAYRHWRYHTK